MMLLKPRPLSRLMIPTINPRRTPLQKSRKIIKHPDKRNQRNSQHRRKQRNIRLIPEIKRISRSIKKRTPKKADQHRNPAHLRHQRIALLLDIPAHNRNISQKHNTLRDNKHRCHKSNKQRHQKYDHKITSSP